MRMRKLASCILAIAASTAISLGATDAMAWIGLDVSPYPFWGKVPVKYYINTSTFPAEIKDTAQQRLIDGFASWSAPDCTSFATQLVGDLPDGTFLENDGKNVLLWINEPGAWPADLGDVTSVIGVTLPKWSDDGQGNQIIYDADIVFNNVGFCWYDAKVGAPSCAGKTPVDTQSIATHEQGHFLGLGHTDVPGATMEPAYNGGDSLASIEQDDIEGVCALYPVGGGTSSTASGGGAQCESCRLGAENKECITQKKACAGACLDICDCLAICSTLEPKDYDKCATACSYQFPEGVTPYLNYTNCLCAVCDKPCEGRCEGIPCDRGGGGGGGSGGSREGFYASGGGGCTVYGNEARLFALGTVVVAAAAVARRRRRR